MGTVVVVVVVLFKFLEVVSDVWFYEYAVDKSFVLWAMHVWACCF